MVKFIFQSLQQMHSYPFLVLIVFLYAAVLSFAASGAVLWFPDMLAQSHRATEVGETLFELGNTFLGVGGITAPVMDIVLHKDTHPKSR